ncbi:hypothetical protein [Burkholderia pseudomultivorans]|uniref:hypothetical protein n=1 Tax=Burkholderia pseudomultivorans TaxID=1207504 RepID=UPI0007C8788F|nr:hypothetical protein [Burkholderia pseudomultivorans]
MTADSNKEQASFDVNPISCLGEASAAHVLADNALSTREAIVSKVVAGPPETRWPTFIDHIGPLGAIPMFVTKTNARELFGLRPGETIAQALARGDTGS